MGATQSSTAGPTWKGKDVFRAVRGRKTVENTGSSVTAKEAAAAILALHDDVSLTTDETEHHHYHEDLQEEEDEEDGTLHACFYV
jgi:hypothetical protein